MLHRGFITILAACFLMLESYHATFLSVKRGFFCPLNISQLVVRKNFSYLALLTTQDSRNALQNTHIERVPEQLTKNLVCGWTRFFIASVDHSNAQGQVHSSVWVLQMVVMNNLESVCKSIKNRWFVATSFVSSSDASFHLLVRANAARTCEERDCGVHNHSLSLNSRLPGYQSACRTAACPHL